MKRTRVNQPAGFRAQHRTHVNRYRCIKHEYDFYPIDWTENGVTYKKGYYDENGVHYNAVAFQNQPTELQCPYCGSHNKIVWTSGPLPKCPNCGGEYEKVATDTIESTNFKDDTLVGVRKQQQSPITSVKVVFIVVGIIMVAFLFIGLGMVNAFRHNVQNELSQITEDLQESGYNGYGDGSSSNENLPSSIYVDEIGRTCYYDGGNYIDTESNCWFWFNTDVEPAQWQYWYDGISSDYDSGWMEYEDATDTWYIETDDGWDVLPSRYDTSNLWHFDNAYDGSILE